MPQTRPSILELIRGSIELSEVRKVCRSDCVQFSPRDSADIPADEYKMAQALLDLSMLFRLGLGRIQFCGESLAFEAESVVLIRNQLAETVSVCSCLS